MPAAYPGLGPFRIVDPDRPLGRGGMAVVWHAVHERTALPAAIKVVDVGDARAIAALRDEVRAVAELDHPRIVAPLDHGVLEGDGPLGPKGAPWLALELARYGSLAERPPAPTWDAVRRTLIALLEALAHAHAAGLVHGDVKPGNALWRGRDDDTLALADFGVARRLREAGAASTVGGTPAWMAPEQRAGDLRQMGPWSDLFAVGCVGWALFHGAPPTDSAAAWAPTLPCPPETERFLRRLLEPRPERRLRHAADARHVLLSLGDAPGSGRVARSSVARTVPAAQVSEPVDPLHAAVAAGALPPFPERPPRVPVRALPRDLGLGLLDARRLPVVGRERAQQQLWETMAAVRENGRPRLVVLSGATGTGKTHLAEWAARTLDEVGSAAVLSAHASPAEDGLVEAVRRHLRVEGLEGTALARRLRAVLPPDLDALDVSALGAWLEGHGPATWEEREEAARRYLARTSRDRPLLLLLDDLQWSPAGRAIAGRLLAGASLGSAPVLLLATVRIEATDESVRAEIEALLSTPDAVRIELEPLDPQARSALVRECLGLSGSLAVEVEERSGGNPLLAVQLAREQVRRGTLRAGALGIRLREGAVAAVPEALQVLGRAALDRVLEGPEREALRIAAVLGLEVHEATWREACAAAGHPVPPDLVDRLAEGRLVRRAGGRFTFVHAIVREALLGELDPEAAAAAHRACAGAIDIGALDRRGAHLLAAGEVHAAAAPLLGAAEQALASGECPRALDRLTRLERHLPPTDARRARLLLLKASALRQTGDFAGAAACAREVVRQVEPGGVDAIDAHIELGHALRRSGELEEARQTYAHALQAAEARQEALRQARAHYGLANAAHRLGARDEARRRYEAALGLAPDTELTADCLRCLGVLDRESGALATAQGRLERALEVAARGGVRNVEAAVAYELAVLHRLAGSLDEAEERLRSVLALDERAGRVEDQGASWNALGELARQRGDLAGAERCYRRAQVLLGAAGSADITISRLNLGHVLVERGCLDEGIETLEGCLTELEQAGRRGLLPYVLAPLLRALALHGDRDGFEARLARLEDVLEGPPAAEIARLLREAGVEAGRTEEVERLLLGAESRR